MLGKEYAGQDCALARALEVVGERWTLLVVRDAFYGVRRFGDFQAHLDIPRALLGLWASSPGATPWGGGGGRVQTPAPPPVARSARMPCLHVRKIPVRL